MCLSTETKDHLKPVTKVFLFIFFFFIMENNTERVILSTIHTDKKNFHNRKSDDNCHQTQRKYPEVFFNI